MAQKSGNKKIVSLEFPKGGVWRRNSYQSQAPFTTPDALNVRPVDAVKQRLRGGSRPGLIKSHYTQLGSGAPIRMLNGCTVVQNNDLIFWTDNFDAPSMSSVWSTASWIGTAPTILPDNAAAVTYGIAGGVVRSALAAPDSPLDTSQDYVIEMFICPYNGQHQGNYQIFLRMDNSAPVATTAGVVCELVMPDASGTFSGSLKMYTGSVLTTNVLFTNGTSTYPQSGWFRVAVSGNNVTCYWLENQVLASTGVGVAAGSRFGFGANCTQPAGICLVDIFRIAYKTNNNNQAYRRYTVASAGGLVYKEKEFNTFVVCASTPTLNTDRQIQSAERLQKLYCADNGNPARVSTTGVSAAGVLDDATVADWTALGINANDMVAVVSASTGSTGNWADGTYAFTTIHATNGLTLTGTTGGCTTCTYRIERCPKIYDPAANTLTAWLATTGKGQVPSGCPLICTYRDRMVVAAPPIAPHAYFASRQGDPLDWDYGQPPEDAGRAVAGTNVEGGLLSEPIKALIQGGDDFLIFGCENSISRLEGDWAYGGQHHYLSRSIGVVDKQAWCFGPAHEIVFMSRQGLMMMPPGGGTPQPMSDRIPDELLRLDNTQYYTQLWYDVQARGVHIFITPASGGSGQYHWWFDWTNKSYWPFQLPQTYDPTASMYFSGSCASDCAVLMGCRDGYVRRFHNFQETDEATAFSSYVDYGPIMLGTVYQAGMLLELIGNKAYDSGNIAWAVRTGKSAEEAQINTTTFLSGTWSRTGLNYTARPRMRGGAGMIKISNGTTGRRWAIEGMSAVLERLGKLRV